MTTATSPAAPQHPPDRPVFARLVAELDELGFAPGAVADEPGHTLYTATDSRVVIAVIADAPDPHVCLAATRGGHRWSMHWTAATPDAVQLIALYAVLDDDPAAALGGAATALGIQNLPAAATKPSTAG